MKVDETAMGPLRTGVGALLCLLLAAGCDLAGSARSAPELAGAYVRRHQVWVFHGNEPVEVEVTDQLLLTADSATALRFVLELSALNGEECRLEGLAERRRGVFAHRRGKGGDSCELRFHPEAELIVVTDLESRCRATVCGQADTVDRLTFSPADRAE